MKVPRVVLIHQRARLRSQQRWVSRLMGHRGGAASSESGPFHVEHRRGVLCGTSAEGTGNGNSSGIFFAFLSVITWAWPRWGFDVNVDLETNVKVDGHLVDADGDGERGGWRGRMRLGRRQLEVKMEVEKEVKMGVKVEKEVEVEIDMDTEMKMEQVGGG